MRLRTLIVIGWFILAPVLVGFGAQQAPHVERFTPEGEVRGVRQVQVRFSAPMVPFGDPRGLLEPMEVDCPAPGAARWVDSRNWVYEFENELPAGLRCEFRLKPQLAALDGTTLGGRRNFGFSTGGPAVRSSYPFAGSASLAEDQAFLLALDAEPELDSVLAHVYFSIEGVLERVGVRILEEHELEEILASHRWFRDSSWPAFLAVQPRRRLPNNARVDLIWGAGVTSTSGVATLQDQRLSFKSRGPFAATLVCTRERADADCVPLSPLRLRFSAPVLASLVQGAVLVSEAGRRWDPRLEEGEGNGTGTVSELVFVGPFPEQTRFTIELPAGIRDDAGRELVNADRFPLEVRTAELPPLAKFSGSFGILEWKDSPVLPVTLRNLEPEVQVRELLVEEEGPTPVRPDRASMNGSVLKVPSDQVGRMISWIQLVQRRNWDDRGRSVFDLGDVGTVPFNRLSIPKPHGSKAFEVIGIPLPDPGFYVVEIESEVLGASLLGRDQVMYVPTTALVTNLSVHFKWGLESSLVWVTSLDEGQGVRDAELEILDCEGNRLWSGTTGAEGLVRVAELPAPSEVRRCSYTALDNELLVVARKGEDLAFVHSSWDDGLESWRFRLPMEYRSTLISAHTVMDRTLLRAGETLSMKHFLRRRSTTGFEAVSAEARPKYLLIEHVGSEQLFEIPLEWDALGIAESSWEIPREARLGEYQLWLAQTPIRDYSSNHLSGTFRVEEFRVPLMRGTVHVPTEPQVRPRSLELDLTVEYLSGGGASELPVRFRYYLQPRPVPPRIEALEGFRFGAGPVQEGTFRSGEDVEEAVSREVHSLDLKLDERGSARTRLEQIPEVQVPLTLAGEMEFRDPNGQVTTVATRIPLWPGERLVGIRSERWLRSDSRLEVQAAVVDVAGNPIAGAVVELELFQRRYLSHRKRLVGGFYAYEHLREIRRISSLCQGRTDDRGVLDCVADSPVSGNLILQARHEESDGLFSYAQTDVWLAGESDWWFSVDDHDRMDVIPERRRYEPGETARFQVQMPFRQATALVTVEREGVSEVFVRRLEGNEPVVEVPVLESHGPNVFVSVLAVRGRAGDVRPTATVDLGRPAFKLGIAQVEVGRRGYELKVRVEPEREVFRVRETAAVEVIVTLPDGSPPPAGSEVAVAAVDEGLLELLPNRSWELLDAMLARRSYGIRNSTAQMYVVGKRHFGLKAVPDGGGGGSQLTRELFDTLLLWKGRVRLDEEGRARVNVSLNDSLTRFRIVAVASSGLDRFGTGSATIRSSQDLMVLSGIVPIVRAGDRLRSAFTVRNTTARELEVELSGIVRPIDHRFTRRILSLRPGATEELGWDLHVPAGVDALHYELEATSADVVLDRISVSQKVIPLVRERIIQATLVRPEPKLTLEVERPADALPDRGGVRVLLSDSLAAGISGVDDYMRNYPYGCLEQRVSVAIALRDQRRWEEIVRTLPAHQDQDGLLRYFPGPDAGDVVLTAYVLAAAHESGWQMREALSESMISGLIRFVEGGLRRTPLIPTADLVLRKLAALEAVTRYVPIDVQLLTTIVIEPNLWPTSAVIDWLNILRRVEAIPQRDPLIETAEQILRSRLNFQGTLLTFSQEGRDNLWWLMTTPDANAARLILSLLESGSWREDLPRMLRGLLARQRTGRWDTTLANAWAVLAVEKFVKAFEDVPVGGHTQVSLEGQSRRLVWTPSLSAGEMDLAWPARPGSLSIEHLGSGSPWAVVQSRAAVPLKEPLWSGYRIRKSWSRVDSLEGPGSWRRGDLIRIRLEVEADADMTWVVLEDPLPAGSMILGTGLGGESRLAVEGEQRSYRVWPAYEERSFEAFRVYYRYVPRGTWHVEYTIRLGTEGTFQSPPTRVEALYAPEMFGELPNREVRVEP